MITAFVSVLLAAVMISQEGPPDIAGVWSGEDWGTVVLNLTMPGEYMGSYSQSAGKTPGEFQLKWSPTERRFTGTWREGEEQFGEISLRLVRDEIRGALSTDPKSKTGHARPKLGDVVWSRGAARPVRASAAAGGPPPAPLDLTNFYMMTAAQFERIKSHPWGVVPRGSQTLGNVPLAIGGMLCLWGEANANAGQPYPEKVDDIPVHRKFDTLYVYHAAFYDSRDGSPVYHLTFHYEDGTSSMTTICYGAHLRNWWQMANEPVTELTDSKSKTVWRGDPPKGNREGPSKLRFCITSITNPWPALEVKSISLASAKGYSAGCILAMTTGPADLLK